MNGALDTLLVVGVSVLIAVLAFRAGMRWAVRKRDSSPPADGVPGDNPAGVSIPPTTVPPAGVRLRLIDGSSVTVSTEVAARIAGAADFFPQYRGRS